MGQPANDAGDLDVGALTPTFAPVALPDPGGQLDFENTPFPPLTYCTAPPVPFFEDEIEAAAAQPH